MIENIKMWLQFEVFYYLKIAFMVIFRRLDVVELADFYSTKITFKNIYDKQAMREALVNKDYSEVARIAQESETITEFNEDMYYEFLGKILNYIYLIIGFTIILIILVLVLIGGR